MPPCAKEETQLRRLRLRFPTERRRGSGRSSGWRDLPPGPSGSAGGSRRPPSAGDRRAGNPSSGSSTSDYHGRSEDDNALSGSGHAVNDVIQADTSDSEIDEDMDLYDQLNQLKLNRYTFSSLDWYLTFRQDPSPLDVVLDYILEVILMYECGPVTFDNSFRTRKQQD
jgi:hypothetical protein